jgi:hypothetical protein
VDKRLEAMRARRERVLAERMQLTKILTDARLRCQAVMLDSVATLERCRSARDRRAAQRRNGGGAGFSGTDDGGHSSF